MSPQLEHPTIVTVSSVALVASINVVDVVKTGQLGTTTLRTDSTLSAEPLNFSRLHLVLKILLSLSSILSPSSNTLGRPYPRGSGQLHSWLGRCIVGLKLSALAPESAIISHPRSAPIPLTDFPGFAPLASGEVHVVDATRVATSVTHSFILPHLRHRDPSD
ncbi:hypothetical protein EDB89DRAFT_2158662 [Lactarius sanguifluus]|nr:hypothetical protein EDB89DRAFT_2158662 [Lactarius sanguifluus]